ncbi:hypothetical protein [Muricoccus radiodurans]|uniref:hypothetical protein n=1 Tax=Muricoccus radiodurans TaxID=2231721 RepID=UPI003CF79654
MVFVLLHSRQVVRACDVAEVVLTAQRQAEGKVEAKPATRSRSLPPTGPVVATIDAKLRVVDRIRKVAVYGERIARLDDVPLGLVEDELKILNDALNLADDGNVERAEAGPQVDGARPVTAQTGGADRISLDEAPPV